MYYPAVFAFPEQVPDCRAKPTFRAKPIQEGSLNSEFLDLRFLILRNLRGVVKS